MKDLSLHSGGGDQAKHPVIEAIEKLESVMEAEPLDTEATKTQCRSIQEECDIDLAHRVLAGKNRAYQALYALIEKHSSEEDILTAALDAMSSLCNGQPDLLDLNGIVLLMKSLQIHMDSADVGRSLVKLIRLNCIKHEENRQTFVKHDLIPCLMTLMETQKANPDIVKETCFGLRVLTFDDDVRVPFGKAHDHAKMIVMETGALKKILNICNGTNE